MPRRAYCRKPSCPNYHPRADELCEPCQELQHERHRDHMTLCLHCNALMMTGAFDQHRWNIHRREHFFPRGRRIKI